MKMLKTLIIIEIPMQRIALFIVLFFTGLLFTAVVHADNNNRIDWLQMSGFASLGAVYGDEDHIFQRDMTQPYTFNDRWSWKTDSLLGVQFDATLSHSLTATAQFVVKERAENNINKSLEWAFLRYRPDQNWMVRVGRLGLDIYLLSDYRNVSFAYLWQRPPTEFYGALVLTNFDGPDVSYSTQLETGTLRFKAFTGISKPVVAYTTEENLELDFYPLLGGNIAFESQYWRAQVGLSRVQFSSEVSVAEELLQGLRNPALITIWPEAASLAQRLAVENKYLTFYSAGIAYDNSQWLIQSELGYLDSQWAALRSHVSAYLSIGRRYGAFTPYLVYGAVKPTGDTVDVPPPTISGDPTVDSIYAGAQRYANAIIFNQRTLSLGTRWDARHDLAIKLQWDHSWVKANGGSLWFTSTSGTGFSSDDTVNLFSLSINYLFKP